MPEVLAVALAVAMAVASVAMAVALTYVAKLVALIFLCSWRPGGIAVVEDVDVNARGERHARVAGLRNYGDA